MNNNIIQLKQNAEQARLIGSIDFSNVLKVLDSGLRYVAQTQTPIFDFSEIEKANSAGIALMLAWWREATRLKKKIQWLHIPKNICALIKVSDLEKILEVAC